MRPNSIFGGDCAFDTATIYKVPLIGGRGFENRLGPGNRTNISMLLLPHRKDVYETRMRNEGTLQIVNLCFDPRDQLRSKRLSSISAVTSDEATTIMSGR